MSQHAVAPLVVVAPRRANAAAGPVAALAQPLGAEVELGVEIEDGSEQAGSRDRRGIDQGVGLDALGIDQQVVAMGLHIAEGELPVQPVGGEAMPALGRLAGVAGEGELAEEVLAGEGL